ncbi:hypothetical protein K1Y80_23105 [Streptomyces sp. MAG02]|nr:hypothetical protein [Streptomyces sp. MAG02]
MAKSAFVTGLRVAVAVAGLLHVALGLLTLCRLPGAASRAGVPGRPDISPERGARLDAECTAAAEAASTGPDVQTRLAGSRALKEVRPNSRGMTGRWGRRRRGAAP